MSFQVKDGGGNLITFVSWDTGGGVLVGGSRPHDGTNALSKLFDLDTSGSTHEYELGVGLRISASGGSVEAKGQATMANSLPVAIASNQSAIPVTGTFWQNTQPVSGTVTTTPPSHASTNVDQIAGTTPDTNSGTKSAGTLRVVIATDQPQLTNKLLVTPDSVALPAHQSTNVDQWNGTTVDTNSGNKSAGTLRVVLATDQPQLTNKLLVTPDSVALPAHQSTNVDQLNGTTTDTNSGTKSAGTLRVVIATDQPALTNSLTMTVGSALPAGTNTIGNVVPVAGTTGGATPYSYWVAAGSNQDSQSVKASAGTLYSVTALSVIASLRYLKIYDKASAPTSSDTPKLRLPIPASTSGAGLTLTFPVGLAFANGLAFRVTTGLADNDTGACTANDCVVNLGYN